MKNLTSLPSGFESLNSLQLHDLHDDAHPDDNSAPESGASPKLTGMDIPMDPDPGLASPYMGPQRHLSGVERKLGSLTHSPDTAAPSSPVPHKSEQQQQRLFDMEASNEYSPIVVVLVFLSLAALVLLGLTVAAVFASHFLRDTIFREDVWRSVAGGGRGKKGDVRWSEKEIVGRDEKIPILEGGMDQEVIAPWEVSVESPLTFTTDATKPSESSVEDPDVPSLSDTPAATSSVPIMRDQHCDRTVGLALAEWTYDNWVTHFMMALFGWLGFFFGGARGGQ